MNEYCVKSSFARAIFILLNLELDIKTLNAFVKEF